MSTPAERPAAARGAPLTGTGHFKSCASRGVGGVGEYQDEASPTRDALWYCDATTGPQGRRFSADERWAEIRRRYGPGDVVTDLHYRPEPALRAAVDRTLARMHTVGVPT